MLGIQEKLSIYLTTNGINALEGPVIIAAVPLKENSTFNNAHTSFQSQVTYRVNNLFLFFN